MANTFALVLFDLDGTLVETAPEIADAVNDTLQRFDLPAVNQAQVERWIGHGTQELLIQAVAFASRLDVVAIRSSPGFTQLAAEFSRHYLERAGTRSLLYPHVRTTLQALRAAGVKLAVVTNKEARFTERVLDAHQLTHLLDCVVAGDTLSSKKPHPEGVHHCLAACEVAPRHALLVGDSSIDVATARNAGIPVWAVPYGYNMGVPVAVSGPNRIIGDISALLAEVA